MRKYYFSWPNVSINIEQTLPQYKVLTVLYTFLMIMNLNETNPPWWFGCFGEDK